MAATSEAGQRDLYAQALAARRQSRLLAAQFRESRTKSMENWRLIQAAWDRTHRIQTLRTAAGTDRDRLRRSAYARVQAKLASLPVIEQAKGIIMAQCGWPEDQAFDALRRASQRENIKVRDLAARIVAAVSSAPPAQPEAGRALKAELMRGTPPSPAAPRGPSGKWRASA